MCFKSGIFTILYFALWFHRICDYLWISSKKYFEEKKFNLSHSSESNKTKVIAHKCHMYSDLIFGYQNVLFFGFLIGFIIEKIWNWQKNMTYIIFGLKKLILLTYKTSLLYFLTFYNFSNYAFFILLNKFKKWKIDSLKDINQ